MPAIRPPDPADAAARLIAALSPQTVAELELAADDPAARGRLVADFKRRAVERFPFSEAELREHEMFELFVQDGGGFFATCKLCGGTADETIASAVADEAFWAPMGGPADIQWRTFDAERRVEEQVWLERWYWLLSLARRRWLTGEERYGRLLRGLCLDWIAKSPPPPADSTPHGRPFFWRDMQVTWRVIAGPTVLRLGADCAELDDDFWVSFLDTWLTGVRLLHDEDAKRGRAPGNHQSHIQMGLSYASAIWPQLAEAPRWWAHAQGRLAEHLDNFDADFYSHEISPSYSTFVIQMYRDVTALGRSAGLAVSEKFAALIEPACRALLAASQPGGRLAALTDAYELDVRPFIKLTGRRMGWDLKRWDVNGGGADLPHRAAFAGNGIASIRSAWSADALWCLLDFSPQRGGHWHGGKLAVNLCAGGEPFLVDPGCGDYCVAEFEELRQPKVHNGLLVDGRGDSATLPGRPWSWTSRPTCSLLASGADDGLEYVAAEGVWPAGQGDVRHRRAVALVDGRFFLIADRVDAPGEHEFSFPLHLAPECRVEFPPRSSDVVARGRRAAVRIALVLDPPLQIAVCPGKVSRNGAFRRSLILHRWARAADTLRAATAVCPSADPLPADVQRRAREASEALFRLLDR